MKGVQYFVLFDFIVRFLLSRQVPVDQFVKSQNGNNLHSMGSFGSLAQAYKEQW